LKRHARITAQTAVAILTFAGTGLSTAATAFATTTPQYKLTQKTISLNGTVISKPMGFTYQSGTAQATTYMPIWYVQYMLRKLNITNTWNGQKWTLTAPSDMQVDLTNLQPGTGKDAITLNNALISNVTGIVYPDPDSKIPTTYVPIWYLQHLLTRMGFQYTWDGSNWTMTLAAVTPQFTSYTKTGTKINTYPTETQAQATLASSPGGIVKDVTGKVVFTEPDFAVFTDPSQPPRQEFTVEADAVNLSNNVKNGYVVDMLKHQLLVAPVNTYMLQNGTWTSQLYPFMTFDTPTFAQPGVLYLALDANPSSTPHYTQFYALADSNNNYLGKFGGTWEDAYRTVDLRYAAPATVTAAQIDAWFAQKNSPLGGLGQSFIDAQNLYGVNAVYMMSHSIIETNWGSSIIYQQKNNLFGYGAYDSNPGTDSTAFPTSDYAIRFQAWEVRNNYLTPGFSNFYQSPTLDGMNQHYATDPTWALSIASLMHQFSNQNNVAESSYTQYNATNTPPAPSATQEPAFLMNGAQGTVLQNPYGNLPLYPDIVTAAMDWFPGTLQVGSSGSGVKQLQRALDANGASLTVDGGFGPMTQSAVEAFQQSQGLPATGVVDVATWTKLYPITSMPSVPANSTVQIDQMMPVIYNGISMEFYHVTAGSASGWIPYTVISFTNVYRLQAQGGYSIPVLGADNASAPIVATMHNGDYTVCLSNAADANGMIAIQWVNPNTNQPMTGYVAASSVTLNQIQQQ